MIAWYFGVGVTWAALVAWLIFRAVRQYGKYERVAPVSPPAAQDAPPIDIIVPARNEEANIGRCLDALMAQDYPKRSMRVIVVDDGSTDRTAEIVSHRAQADERLGLLKGQPLPRGWLGKPWAVTQGAHRVTLGCEEGASSCPSPGTPGEVGRGFIKAASPAEAPSLPSPGVPGEGGHSPQRNAAPDAEGKLRPGFAAGNRQAEWLCFIDADTFATPSLIATAVHIATARAIDMLSLEPFQELGSFWERLIMPAGFFLLAFSQDLGRVNDPACPDAVANGQFILIRASVYQSVGGHAAVRGHIAEDSALARRVKAGGHRLAVLGADELIRTRMYRDLPSLWEGLTKTATLIVGGVRPMIFFAIAAIVLGSATLLLPLWTGLAMLHPHSSWCTAGFVLALMGSLAMFGVHIGGAVYFRIPFWYGVLFPMGYTVGSAVGFASAWRHARGRVGWKGRVYSP
jgi:glycosyltransferase involved in cell wall biosynthesis